MPTSKAGTLEDRLEERVRFEQLITDLTASLVRFHPNSWSLYLIRAVRICRQFEPTLRPGEILATAVPLQSLTDRKEKQQKDEARSCIRPPWSHRRLVEREPIPFILTPAAGGRGRPGLWTHEETQSALAGACRRESDPRDRHRLRSHRSGKEWLADHVERLRVFWAKLSPTC